MKQFTTRIVLLFTVLTLNSNLFTPTPAQAASQLTYRGIDVMKYTKDVIKNQPSDAEISNIVDVIVNNIHPTHIAISIPMDSNSDFPATSTPAPRTIENFTQKWADTIHNKGVKIIWRGTYSGIEGIYNFPKKVGSSRFPTGTASSAASDGNNTWLGKIHKYIVDHPSFFQAGDLWAPLPERTENIFQDSTSFLPYSGAGIQENYATFFNDLKTVSDKAFAQIGKNVTTGMTANNYTEIASTWMKQSVLDNAGMIVIDHYGSNHTPQEMDADIRKIAAARGKKVFLQEWGDYWNSNLSQSARSSYLDQMFAVFNKLTADNILVGFNYWGAWTNNQEGILTNSNGNYSLNYRGLKVAEFFGNDPQTVIANPPPPPPPPQQTPENSNNDDMDELEGNFGSSSSSSGGVGGGSVKVSTSNVNYPDGALILDEGTIYVMEFGKKRPIVSMQVFNELGYRLEKVQSADISDVREGKPFLDSDLRHARGTLVNLDGTIYFLGKDVKYGFPSAEVFNSWETDWGKIVAGNSQDQDVPEGPVVVEKS